MRCGRVWWAWGSLSTCFPGSSSSALGLQSLGLSGQAPSSSSLDAGTLSDTTASGNCPQQGARHGARTRSLVLSAVGVSWAAAFDRPFRTSCFCLCLRNTGLEGSDALGKGARGSASFQFACCLASADSPRKAERAVCRLNSFRA